VKVRPVRTLGWALLLCIPLWGTALLADPPYGKLSGLVVDPSGVPQMGATVVLLSEEVRAAAPLQLLTNDRGLFSNEKLQPGLYSVRVTLAGFLPAVERHVRIEPNLITVLRVELDSVFTSLDRLRRQTRPPTESDDWGWILRASAATRPVLRFEGGEVVSDVSAAPEARRKRAAHGRVELTAGARRPGSVSNVADAAATAIAYEQNLGKTQRLIFAGSASYERSTSAGFATVWLPSGEAGRGPQTTLVLRRSDRGDSGPVFLGARLDHSGQLTLGDRFVFRYGAEYILVGLGHSTSSVRPRGELAVQFAPGWQASLTVAPRPFSSLDLPPSGLENALLALDALPAVFLRNGRPVLESGWHDELAVERQLGPNARLVAAVFRDRSRHTAIFGRGAASSPDFFQDFYSHSFAYDGGSSEAWGSRVAFCQRLAPGFEADLIYAWAGVLTPESLNGESGLRRSLGTQSRSSLAARFTGRVPGAGTVFTASYKWVQGRSVSRQDPFGEALYQLDPNLNVRLRQPLPSFFFPGKVEALADFRNLLAQGYVPLNTAEGQFLLVPSFRSFRGGLSFQF
jgi:hypothetical protein